MAQHHWVQSTHTCLNLTGTPTRPEQRQTWKRWVDQRTKHARKIHTPQFSHRPQQITSVGESRLNAYSLRRLYKPRPRPFKPLPLREPLNLGQLILSVLATVVFVGLLLGLVFVAAPDWMPGIAVLLAIPGLIMLVFLLGEIERSLERITSDFGSVTEPDPTPAKPSRSEARANDTVGTDRSTRDEEWDDGAA